MISHPGKPGIASKKTYTKAAANPEKKISKTKTGASVKSNRKQMLDHMANSIKSVPHDIESSVQRSKEAFQVLRQHASSGALMVNNVKTLQETGALAHLSPIEVESLVYPVPPSLHLRQPVNVGSADRVDCVLALGEPEPTGEARRLLLQTLAAVQRGPTAFEKLSSANDEDRYKIDLPPEVLSTHASASPMQNHNVSCIFTVKQAALQRMSLVQNNTTFLDIQFLSPVDADQAMLASLRQVNGQKFETFNSHKYILMTYSKWSQAQRSSGVFRPLLKDVLLRSGTAKSDPDLKAFHEFFFASSKSPSSRRLTETFVAFDGFRTNTTGKERKVNPADANWIELFKAHSIEQKKDNKKDTVKNLQAIARYLVRENLNTTLQEICGPGHSTADFTKILDGIIKTRLLTSKQFSSSVRALQLFMVNFRPGIFPAGPIGPV
jgi:hypothetical protein